MVKLYNVDGKVLYKYPQYEDLRDALEDAVKIGFNLEGIDLSHQNLSGCDLRGMYAPNADFSNAIMNSCDLRGADLSSAKFIGTETDNITIKDCKLRNIFFSEYVEE